MIYRMNKEEDTREFLKEHKAQFAHKPEEGASFLQRVAERQRANLNEVLSEGDAEELQQADEYRRAVELIEAAVKE